MKTKLFTLCLLVSVFFANAQNVGIGTAAPQVKLHVVSSDNEALRLDAPYPYLSLYSGGVYQGYFWRSSNSIEIGSASGTNLPITFAPNGYQLMYIGANGNVGIGTTTPNAPLSFAPALGKKITLYPGATGDVGMAVQGNLFQIYSDNPSADIAFGYDQGGTMTERMRIKANGNVGIGTTSPVAKLHVSAGDASLALFGPNSTYGGKLYVGASPNNQSGALTAQVNVSDGNLHIDPAAGKNLYFGYFQARDIYLNPNGGQVGIGNANPGYQLDVSNRMRIRSGGNNSVSAGLWLNNNTNDLAAFIGMEDDTHVGIFGIGTGWKFGMNTQTGALKINGSEGQAGQLLQSNSLQAPEWRNNPVTDMYNLTQEIVSTGGITLVSGLDGDVPGLTKTLVLAKSSKVIVHFTVFASTTGCAFCSGTTFDLFIILNGGNTGAIRNSVGNGSAVHVTGCRIFTLAAGTHSIKIFGRNLSGPNLEFGQSGGNAYPSFMTIQVIPQN